MHLWWPFGQLIEWHEDGRAAAAGVIVALQVWPLQGKEYVGWRKGTPSREGFDVRLPCGRWGTRSYGPHTAGMCHGHTWRSCSLAGPDTQDTWSANGWKETITGHGFVVIKSFLTQRITNPGQFIAQYLWCLFDARTFYSFHCLTFHFNSSRGFHEPHLLSACKA